jgi:hypothetical protein
MEYSPGYTHSFRLKNKSKYLHRMKLNKVSSVSTGMKAEKNNSRKTKISLKCMDIKQYILKQLMGQINNHKRK